MVEDSDDEMRDREDKFYKVDEPLSRSEYIPIEATVQLLHSQMVRLTLPSKFWLTSPRRTSGG